MTLRRSDSRVKVTNGRYSNVSARKLQGVAIRRLCNAEVINGIVILPSSFDFDFFSPTSY